MIQSILSIDPGVTTGFALTYIDGEHVYVAPSEGKLSLRAMNNLISTSVHHPIDAIIYEDFEYRNAARPGLDLTPVKMIGIIEMYGEYFTKANVVFAKQKASQAKTFVNDDKLRHMRLWSVGKKHARDAIRHTVFWILTRSEHGMRELDWHLTDLPWIEEMYFARPGRSTLRLEWS